MQWLYLIRCNKSALVVPVMTMLYRILRYCSESYRIVLVLQGYYSLFKSSDAGLIVESWNICSRA